VDVDEGSLMKDTIVIKKVEVVEPDVTYEKEGKTDNFQALLANVQKNMPKGESPKKEPEKEGQGKKLIINDFVIKKGKVNLAGETPGGIVGGKQISADLPEIHLKDIGQNKGGASPADVAKEIFEAVYAKMTGPIVMGALNAQLKKLGGAVQGAVEKVTQEGLKGAKGVVEGAGKAAGDVTEKVKGLLGTGK
jgi:hypothetical protein